MSTTIVLYVFFARRAPLRPAPTPSSCGSRSASCSTTATSPSIFSSTVSVERPFDRPSGKPLAASGATPTERGVGIVRPISAGSGGRVHGLALQLSPLRSHGCKWWTCRVGRCRAGMDRHRSFEARGSNTDIESDSVINMWTFSTSYRKFYVLQGRI